MIHTVWPLPIGTALRLFLSPPADALRWRILRKGADDFSGPDDASAVVVYEGDDKVVVDTQFLKNNVVAFYRPYYWIDDAWVAGPTASGTPVASYQDASTDVQSIVRQRLEEGFAEEVRRKALHNDLGYIQVFTAPPQITSDLRLPLVTVELLSETPPTRGLGEDMTASTDFQVIGGILRDSEGWLAEVTLQIVCWSLNPDERIDLRKALRRIIVGNLPVFDEAGMVQVGLSLQDADMMNNELGAPLYQCVASFTCLAPVIVQSETRTITGIESEIAE